MIQTKDSTDAPGSEPGELSADETDDDADSVSSAAGAREKAERSCIIAGLEKNGWHRGRTAESLGMNKATLWRKMKKYGISGN
jgi:transcriptional regulator of acetoin/glycerol metabolism